jgi:ABC-type multidrug transport system fused ATPase/permease subunit
MKNELCSVTIVLSLLSSSSISFVLSLCLSVSRFFSLVCRYLFLVLFLLTGIALLLRATIQHFLTVKNKTRKASTAATAAAAATTTKKKKNRNKEKRNYYSIISGSNSSSSGQIQWKTGGHSYVSTKFKLIFSNRHGPYKQLFPYL